MRNIVFGFFAIIMMPVLVVVALAGISGVLTRGATAVADSRVNGYSLNDLRDLERATLGNEARYFPLSEVISSFDREASTLSVGRDVEPLLGHVVLANARYEEVVGYYDQLALDADFERIAVPTPLEAFGDEDGAVAWRWENVVLRVVRKTDPFLLVESGGGSADTVYEYILTPLYADPDE